MFRVATVPVFLALTLAAAPAVYADEPVNGQGHSTVSLVPVAEHTADGNTFIDYTITETFSGIVEGTRVGAGTLVIHPDGSLNSTNDGIFTGTIAGSSGTAEIHVSVEGTFAGAVANFTVTNGTGGLAGVHAQGTDHGSATGPTSLAGTYSIKVNFSAS